MIIIALILLFIVSFVAQTGRRIRTAWRSGRRAAAARNMAFGVAWNGAGEAGRMMARRHARGSGAAGSAPPAQGGGPENTKGSQAEACNPLILLLISGADCRFRTGHLMITNRWDFDFR
ncbi:hypothetical protein ACFOLJ_08330 [Rugamonas sp. CCM 8940]|uniref:hypothetical protein n=1 Tax=Rugamonas sp. CCM 8940 TaxID=2765359 RepID=UPI0018F3EBB3|nr:hypothetical protein [Rugamonas sp. CCM 8940]MBJ7309525.1 hypothetical protein [Rugamonas sp. CCM 8940]